MGKKLFSLIFVFFNKYDPTNTENLFKLIVYSTKRQFHNFFFGAPWLILFRLKIFPNFLQLFMIYYLKPPNCLRFKNQLVEFLLFKKLLIFL